MGTAIKATPAGVEVGSEQEVRHKISHIATPLTHITYSESIRFIKPEQPTFGFLGSILSIMSLMFMSSMSMLMFMVLAFPELNVITQLNLGNPFINMLKQANNLSFAAWVWIPFAFTIFGSVLGWTFELGLLLVGKPFQVRNNAFARFITQVRLLNLAPVTSSIFFFICAISVQSPDLRMALYFASAVAMFSLGFALFFASKAASVQLSLLGMQVVQMLVVWGASAHLETSVIALLVGQSVLQLATLLMGIATPVKSTIFHVTNTIAGVLLFAAILQVSGVDPAFSVNVMPEIASGSLMMWGLVISCLAAVILTAKALPDAYNNFRSILSNTIWAPIYFKLVSAERFPNPVNLSQVYDKVKPKKTPLCPYYQAHPEHLVQSLSIPAVADEDIEANVTVFKTLMSQALGAFKLITFLDYNAPQADLKTPLSDKPRMAIWSNGSEYWPTLFKKHIFGSYLPNGGELAPAPHAAITAFKAGQLLAYLTESGVGNPFAKQAEHRGVGAVMIDFRFLEKYETKTDYEPYGGMAYFYVNGQTQKLELVSVVAPYGNVEINANPHDPEFRRVESLVLASLYFQVISGKHLA